jgi:hypothetical protein
MVVSRLTLQLRALAVQEHAISAAFVMTTIAIHYQYKAQQQLQRPGWRGQACARKRVSMQEVFVSLGPIYFWHSFCMSYNSFNKLLGILSPGICQLSRKPETDVSILHMCQTERLLWHSIWDVICRLPPAHLYMT